MGDVAPMALWRRRETEREEVFPLLFEGPLPEARAPDLTLARERRGFLKSIGEVSDTKGLKGRYAAFRNALERARAEGDVFLEKWLLERALPRLEKRALQILSR